MNPALTTAAALTVLLAAAHSYLGERYILIPLFRRGDLPLLLGGTRFTQDTLRLAWHVTTVLAFGFTGLLVALALPVTVEPRVYGWVIATTFAACGFVALIGSRGRHLSWIVFFIISALTFWVLR